MKYSKPLKLALNLFYIVAWNQNGDLIILLYTRLWDIPAVYNKVPAFIEILSLKLLINLVSHNKPNNFNSFTTNHLDMI